MIHVIKKEIPSKYTQIYLIDRKKNKLGLHDVCRCTYYGGTEIPYRDIWATNSGPFRKYDKERYILTYDLPNNITRHENGRICIQNNTLNTITKTVKGALGDF